jgi:flavin reductase
VSFIDAASFKSAMSHVAGAVFIITTTDRGIPWGLTATAVCSFMADPATLIACINRDAEMHDRVLASRCLCVNLLSAGQTDVANCFSGRHGHKAQERFAHVGWHAGLTGAPVLDRCILALDCQVVKTFDARTHTAFVCGVIDLKVPEELRIDPLLYFQRDFARVQT